MVSLASSIRKTGPLAAIVARKYRERVEAGIIAPQEEPRAPVVLVSVNGGKLVEEGDGVTVVEPRREVMRRRISPPIKTTPNEGKIYHRMSWIAEATARYFEVDLDDIYGERKLIKISHPRQVAMYLSKKLTIRSRVEIGKEFGGRDHTTVIHAIKAVEKRRAADAELDRKIGILEQIILQGMQR